VRAMVTGDRSGLSPQLQERFRAAGIAHVLAVSGLHLAVVAVLAFAAVRRLWAAISALAMRVEPAVAAALVAAPLAIGFTLMTGARVSTVRALLVVLLVLAGFATSRRARVIDALGLAALILLGLRPETLLDPSFQLSFAATAVLALAMGPRRTELRPHDRGRRQERRLGRRLWRAIGAGLGSLAAASLWANAATAPLSALAFGSVAVAGIASNLLAVPLVELCIVPLGVLGCALLPLWPAAAGVCIDIAVAAAAVLDRLAALAAEAIPTLTVFPPNGWELAGLAAMLGGALAARRRALPLWLAGSAIAAGAVAVLLAHGLAGYWLPAQRDGLRIDFLDVGQGDAAVVQLPGGATWMVDGGGLPFTVYRPATGGSRAAPEESAEAARRRLAALPGDRAIVRFLAHRRIRTIERLVLSHPHPDHYAGVRAVARHVPIAEVWIARGQDRTSASYRDLLGELTAAGTRIVHPRLDVGYRHRDVVLTALAPRYLGPVASADPISSVNDNSLVVRLDYAGRSILFTGDVEREGEEL
ncbi:MAG: ComEC/Rec2 family competence protein, partial [Myxococcota bacterium]